MISGNGRSTLVPAMWISTSTPASSRSTTAGSRRSPCITSSPADDRLQRLRTPGRTQVYAALDEFGRSTVPMAPLAPESATLGLSVIPIRLAVVASWRH